MSYVNIYKVKTKIADSKYTHYVVARSFGEAVQICNVKDDTVTSVKCLQENVDYRHLAKPYNP